MLGRPSPLLLVPWLWVEDSVAPEPNTGCLLWTGRTLKGGHGVFSFRGKSYLAHRAAWEWLVGPIQPGRHLHHGCEQPSCVNVEHLFPLTQRQHLRVHRGLGRVFRLPTGATPPPGAVCLEASR